MPKQQLSDEDIDRIFQDNFGMSAAEYEKLPFEERVQQAYDSGRPFASHGVAAMDKKGRPVTSYKGNLRWRLRQLVWPATIVTLFFVAGLLLLLKASA